MDYLSGDTIRALRERKGMTQRQLADKLMLTDKAVSKWEMGHGYPDIAILPELAEALGVSVAELLTGDVAVNRNVSANIRRGKFYVCPLCGNVIFAMGEGAYSCCGVRLPALEPEAQDDAHAIEIEDMDGEWFVHIDHPMTKKHYISFVALVTGDTLQLKKLYPEQEAELRLRRAGHGMIVAYCNRDGLFTRKI